MKNYLIIGGSSGIGKKLSELLLEDGNNVYASYHNSEVDKTSGIKYFPLDITQDELDTGFLPEQIDGLAYCVGSINLKPFHRITVEEFRNDFDLQVGGAVKVIQQILKNLKVSGNASIVLFSTVAVQNGFNFHSQVSASKGAVEGLTRALAAEFAPLIRVNAIAPSLTDTPLASRLLNTEEKKEANAQNHPLKRIGKAEDIANMAVFLLSEKSSWISGQILHVDGGMSTINK